MRSSSRLASRVVRHGHCRLAAALLVLVALVWWFGTGPFLDGLRSATWQGLTGALLLTLVTSLASALRWQVVARRLGLALGTGEALLSLYRSQFLNAVLPGGVLGDVHRAVAHGREVGDVSAAARAVLWEKTLGHVVQWCLLVVALAVAPDPFREFGLLVLVPVVVLVVIAGALSRTRASNTLLADLRALSATDPLTRVAILSVVITLGRVGLFVLAALGAGVHASYPTLVAAALLIQVGGSVPINFAGWGPREGVAAWVFSLVGLGAGLGLTSAVGFGVLSGFGVLPGAVVLLVGVRTRRRRDAAARLTMAAEATAPVAALNPA